MEAGGQLHVAVAGTTMNDEIRQFISRRKKMRRAVEKASQEKAMQVERARQVERSSQLPARKRPERSGPERGGPERDFGPSR